MHPVNVIYWNHPVSPPPHTELVSMQRIMITLTASLMCLTACSPALPVSSTPTAPKAVTSTPDQLNLFATQTQSAALAATSASQQEPDSTPIPVTSPAPLPTITLVLQEAGPFRQVSQQEALILGMVLELRPVNDGLLLFSEGGISYYKDDQWTGYFTQEMGYPLGADASGRAWSIAGDGSQINQSLIPLTDHRTPTDEAEMWKSFRAEEGWVPVSRFAGSPVKFGLVSGDHGDLWFATQQDVRVFDSTWRVFDPSSMGMPEPAEDTVSEYTIYPLPGRAEVYAGRCDWGSTGPVGGGGWRMFDGQIWAQPDPALNAGCLTAFTQDEEGGIWIAQDANLWRYSPDSAILEQAALPEPSASYRFGYINSLNAAPDGSLWAQLALCSADACFGGEAVYRLKDGNWQQIGEPNPAAGQKLLFDKAGTPWLLSGGSIYQVEGEVLLPVPGLLVQAAATDDAGDLWLIAQASGPPTLWKLNQ